MLLFKTLQCISSLKDEMPTFHPRINFKDQKWTPRLLRTMELQHMYPQSLLSTFVNHAKAQHTIKRILREAPVSKATSEAGASLISGCTLTFSGGDGVVQRSGMIEPLLKLLLKTQSELAVTFQPPCSVTMHSVL